MFTHTSLNHGRKAIVLSLSALFALLLLVNLLPQKIETISAAGNPSNPSEDYQIQLSTAVTSTVFIPSILKPFGPPKLLFVSDRAKANEYDIYSMNLQGGDVQELASVGKSTGFYNPEPPILYPVWSPDGTQIAYILDGVLYLMGSDGTNNQAVVDDPDFVARGIPSWSPDSSAIAFVSVKCTNPPTCNTFTSLGSGVSVYELGNDQTKLVIDINIFFSRYVTPQWLSDGSAILAVEADGHNSNLYKGYLNGSPFEIILGTEFSEFDPLKISPDGAQIAFENQDLFVMNVDGSDKQMIHENSSLDKSIISDFSWHPNGQKIAMAVFKDVIPDRESEIHIIDVSTTNKIHVTTYDSTSTKLLMGWTRDGGQLIYSSDLNRTQWAFDVYIVNADGSNPINLTANFPLDDRATDVFP